MNILLNTSKRPKVPSCHRNDSDNRTQQQDPKVLGQRKRSAARDHEDGSTEEDFPPSNTVCNQSEEGAEEHIAEEGQGHKDADTVVGEAESGEEDRWWCVSERGRGRMLREEVDRVYWGLREGQATEEEGICAICEHATGPGDDDKVGIAAGVVYGIDAEFVIEPLQRLCDGRHLVDICLWNSRRSDFVKCSAIAQCFEDMHKEICMKIARIPW